MTREELSYMFKITERAEYLGIMMFDRISLKMDLEIAHKQFNLRLKNLLDADDFNFSHDIVGTRVAS